MLSHKAAAVDPLVERFWRATARRFRAQEQRAVGALERFQEADRDRALDPKEIVAIAAILHAINDYHDPTYADLLRKLGMIAAGSGSSIAAGELGEATALDVSSSSAVSSYLLRRAESIERDLDTTTMSRLQALFRDFSPAEWLDRIRLEFAGFVSDRAPMIAITEISGAFHAGAIAMARSVGGEVEKLWSSEPDACEECLENTDEGFIGIDEEFPNFGGSPPGHPHCRCSLEFRQSRG